MLLKLIKPFVGFRFVILAGIIMGGWLFAVQTEQVPISALLTESRVYFLSFLIVFGFHVLLWIIVQKASLYDVGGYIWRIIRDTVVINAAALSTIAACFLLHTFLF